jgi:fructose-1,6-bisphosphatase/sedoheptulose 1,7-bisphosphatase-like protein
VGPAAKGAVDLEAPVKHNLKAIARRLGRGVDDLVVVVLDRPRHAKLIADIREAGARIRLISDGDLSAGIAAAVAGTGVHAVMGSGGAPEGVLTAAALRCLNGEILGRLVVKDEAQKERMQAMGIADVNRIYTAPELAPGRNLVFVACGVTGGDLLQGVRFTGDGVHTQSIVMNSNPARVRFVDTTHLENKPDVKVRFLVRPRLKLPSPLRHHRPIRAATGFDGLEIESFESVLVFGKVQFPKREEVFADI